MGFAQIAALALLGAGCLDTAAPAADGGAPLDLAAPQGSADLSTSDGATAPDLATPDTLYVYVSGYAPQIARFVLDPSSGALTAAGTTTATGTPSFLAVDAARRHLYAVDEANSKVQAYLIDPAAGGLTHLGDVASGGSGPAHLSVAPGGKWVLAANYGDGAVAVLPIAADGSLGAAVDTKSAGANAHQILADPTGTWAFVPCKGADYVAQYALSASGTLTPNAVATAPTATGAGPRHLAFHPTAPFVYLIDETDSTMTVWSYDASAGRIAKQQTLSTRSAGATATNTAAEVVLHPNARWLYGSNRGDDNIVQFSVASSGQLTAIGWTATGQTPRSFTIDPSGRWLLVADQGSNDMRVFAIDQTSGGLSAVGAPVTAPSPSFVGVVPLP
jgi:6-phosphogluconolactonase